MTLKDNILCTDLTNGALYEQVKIYYEKSLVRDEDALGDATNLSSSHDGSKYALEGLVYRSASAPPKRKVKIVNPQTGQSDILDTGEANAFDPKWSKVSDRLSFLTYDQEIGTQLKLSDTHAKLHECPVCPGGDIVFYRWAHNSDKIAAIAVKQDEVPTRQEEWTPTVLPGSSKPRSLWTFVVDSNSWELIETPELHWWEIDWCGDKLVGIASSEPTEQSWFSSNLYELTASDINLLSESSERQIGLVAGNPTGSKAAFIETIAQERFVLAGELRIMDAARHELISIDTNSVDVTHLEWRNENILSYSGMRLSETVVADLDVGTGDIIEHYASKELTSGPIYPVSTPLPDGSHIMISESFKTPPHIARMNRTSYERIPNDALNGVTPEFLKDVQVEPIYWNSSDGMDLCGWLYRPSGEDPFPVVMDVHGGPVWAARNRWHARLRGTALLAAHGVASFFPNPRGSTGGGLELVSAIKGEVGGKDIEDCIRGLESLISNGTADPKALGICGISYGGFVSAKTITEYDIFSAAVIISPITDFLSSHWTTIEYSTNEDFLDGNPFDSAGPFVTRSPVYDANKVTTPTLILAAGRDQITPPWQATMFYNALRASEAEATLITYPNAGHGVLDLPELVDATTRSVGWFLHHFNIPHKCILPEHFCATIG